MLNPKKSDRNESWCTLSVDNVMITAKIQHIGRGRYKILATEDGGEKYINNVVDASDIFRCKRE